VSARILYIAYPLLSVSEESAGGAEQVLWTLEREMAQRGVQTAVAASAGSRISGELLPTGVPCGQLDDFERRNREHQEKILGFLRRRERSFDLVHDMSGSFWVRGAEVDLPVLATLHLPRSFYPSQSFQSVAPNVSFNCVSNSQASSFTDLENTLGVVPNGIALDRFNPQDDEQHPKQGLLWLGRICEEKAPHLALEIAARAGLPITLAGQVYPFSYHQQYFEREVAPRLRKTPNAKMVNSPSFEQKRRLLRDAEAVLITSQAAETSSLVGMEAAAAGTPVIAFRRGALPEVVQDQTTGFLVGDVEEAIQACGRLTSIDRNVCGLHARKNFGSENMADGYARFYAQVLSSDRATAALDVL
jgi:glycosyltransferase involved in cell wall biosynthesis